MPSLTIGDFRISLVRLGAYWWDGGAMYGVVPKTLWSKHSPSDDLNRVEAAFNCYVIETGGHRILVETGGGIRFDERTRERQNTPNPARIRESLSAAGFEPETFDIVINTHLHWDHCGGNTVDENGRAVPALPHATYYTQRGELLHAREQHPRDAVSYRAVNYEPLLECGRLHLLEGDHELLPGLHLRVTPGHNRDMMTVIVRPPSNSAGSAWLHLADLARFSAQVTPTWLAAFDLFPLETIAQKQDLLTRAAAEGWWLSFAHEPKLAFARVESRDGKWRTHSART